MVAMVSAITMLPGAKINIGRAYRDPGEDQQRDQRDYVLGGFGFRICGVFDMRAHVIK